MKTCARCCREGTRAFKRREYNMQPPWVCANAGACSDRALDRGTPPDAIHVPSWTSAVDIHGGDKRPSEDLKLGAVIGIDGGSMLWFEEPDTLVVWHVNQATGRQPWPTRYKGTWRPCDCARNRGVS